MSDETSMMNKKPEDLTVGEALKLNGLVIAAVMAAPVVFFGAVALGEKAVLKVRDRKNRRKNKKNDLEVVK